MSLFFVVFYDFHFFDGLTSHIHLFWQSDFHFHSFAEILGAYLISYLISCSTSSFHFQVRLAIKPQVDLVWFHVASCGFPRGLCGFVRDRVVLWHSHPHVTYQS